MWILNEKYSLKTLHPAVTTANPELITELLKFPLLQNIWIEGEAGGGKSHLARATGNRYAYRDRRVEWMSGPEFRLIGEMWPSDREDEQLRLAAAHLLIIDDIDKCLWTPKALEAAWYLMECRHKNRYRTIVTANCSGKAMMEAWRAIPGVNQSWPVATLDLFQPCAGFLVKSNGSLRKVI